VIRENLPKTVSGAASSDTPLPQELSLRKHLSYEAWNLLRQVYRAELVHGELGLGKRVATRLGLNPVNGFGRKLREIRRECPELAGEIDEMLSH